MTLVHERTWVEQLVAGMPRSPHQVNELHESDAELVRIPGTDVTLAVTTDGVVEEISSGLYDDPYLMGWMAITVNASDLAAVGAAPLGVLVSESLPPDLKASDVARLQDGIRDAAGRHGLPVMGGDTNASPSLQITATAIGLLPNGPVLSRRGAQVGDYVFVSGRLGLGSAFALERMIPGVGHRNAPIPYQPMARLREGRLLLEWASACMDTSDGVLPSLDELMRVNGIGVRLDCPTAAMLHRAALEGARAAGIPPWTMLAGPHGEFELVFTIPARRRSGFLTAAAAMEWEPLELGVVVEEPACMCRMGGRWATLDTGLIRNLFADVGGDADRFIAELPTAVRGVPKTSTADADSESAVAGVHASLDSGRANQC